jgi:hypothetical protein
VKLEAADRISKTDKPAEPTVRPGVQSDQRAFEVVRDIATTLLAMDDRQSVVLKVHSSSGGLFNWQSSAEKPCGPARAAQAMREAYESVFLGKQAESPAERDTDLAMLRNLNASNVSDSFKAEVTTMDRRELMRRVVRLSDWVTAYQKCLEGLGFEFTQPL